MGKLAKIVAIVAAVGALPLMYLVVLVVSSWNKGYTWGQMDWDGDGHMSVNEFLMAGDTDTRPITQDGRACREIYFLKDGVAAKVLCP